MYEIIFMSPAENFLKKLDKKNQKKIIEKIKKLKSNPFLGKPLSGPLSGLRRLRQDKFRIIYNIKEKELTVFIIKIGHRKKIYK